MKLSALSCLLQVINFCHCFYYDVCPRGDIAPCTCDHDGMNCNSVSEVNEIENAFKTIFKYNAIRALYLQGTSLKELSAGIFQNVKIQEIYLEDNQLTTFSLDTLNHSKDFTHTVSLYGNKLNNFAFGDLTSFEKLRSLNLAENRIRSIPENAFRYNNELREIALQGNLITTVGENAFDDLPELRRILLSSNPIQTLGPNSMNFHPDVKDLQVDLHNSSISEISKSAFGKGELRMLNLGRNKLTYLDEDIFHGLSQKVGNKRGRIDVKGNPLTCTGCEYKWILPDKYMLQEVIVNFICPDGSLLSQLTIHKIKCHKK